MEHSADPPEVVLEPHPHQPRLGLLRLDRPPVNALSQRMWDDLHEVAGSLHDEACPYRAVVIAGTGRHFAAGADIKEILGLSSEDFGRRNRVLQGAFQLIATAPQVTVAAVNGYALGGGCELALAADFRIAGTQTSLGLPEVTLGIMPGSGGTQRLAGIVGLGRAKDMVLSGRRVDATEALAIGLVSEVVDDDQVLARAVELGLDFAAGPAALTYAKRSLQASVDLSIGVGLEFEAQAIAECFATEDAQIGLRSFAEHGPGRAIFKGR